MYVNKTDTCWLWTGMLHKDGYGFGKVDGKMTLMHRWAYKLLVGPIPEGMTLDHTCRVRNCVNPAHLEPVTNGENQNRGLNTYAIRTHCKSGLHDITIPGSVTHYPSGNPQCTECLKVSSRRARLKYEAKIRAGNTGSVRVDSA